MFWLAVLGGRPFPILSRCGNLPRYLTCLPTPPPLSASAPFPAPPRPVPFRVTPPQKCVLHPPPPSFVVTVAISFALLAVFAPHLPGSPSDMFSHPTGLSEFVLASSPVSLAVPSQYDFTNVLSMFPSPGPLPAPVPPSQTRPSYRL